MRYLSVLFASQPATPPPPELFEAIMALGQEATTAGVMLDMGGLLPHTRTDVTVQSDELSVLDGPFTETKELVAGFWLWQVRDLDEAVEWVKRCPNPMPGDSEIEIRPLYEDGDFGDALTPELKEQEDRLRAEVAQQ